ncbi:olfactory receptor 52D1-like [Megalops cyprinoides]|uniref:olfactory receptor 52D1-like n=1 Tax=Megalops cyprinoides TaxID=118141 RepID=UPI001863BE85|nr:olfactory receptor 52D1-like [Megalops cyprinoides]
MDNTSDVTSIVLTGFENIGSIRYFYFCVILILYFSIIFANSLIIGVICTDRGLREPMYLLLCNLSVTELYGSTALYPSLLVNMLLDIHEVSKIFCFVQIFCLFTYGSIEFSSLSVMAYDRYVSICYPLEYHSIMTPTKVYILIILIWFYCTLKVSVTIGLTARLPLCGNTIYKVYCDNYSLVRLSCVDSTANNIYGLVSLVFTVVIPSLLIVYSYSKILRICLRSSKESQVKALKTCTPHLASLINFSLGCLFEIVQSRFDMMHVPSIVRIFVSVYFLMICPIFNPIIYGVRTTKIRAVFKKVYARWLTPLGIHVK